MSRAGKRQSFARSNESPRAERTQFQNRARKTVSVILVFACLSACVGRRDPQAAYDHAQQTLEHGDMAAAAQEAEEGYKNFRNRSAEWAWKFTILRATVLRWRGMNEEVLKLMDSQPEPPQSGDLAVQIQRLEGVAYGSLLNFPEAERKLAKAERFCAVADSPACEEVIRARAVLALL